MTSNSTRDLVSQPYKYGFVTEIETDKIAKGLSEKVVRLISAKKEEPAPAEPKKKKKGGCCAKA